MGAAMTPEEFIKKNLKAELEKSGTPYVEIEGLSNEGVRYWRETAKFRKSAWVDTLSYVKKRAKQG